MKSGAQPGQDRVTVSLSPGRLEQVKARVARGEAMSVSAYVDRVLAQNEQARSLEQVLDDMDAEYGAPSGADNDWARTVLGT